ncbi:hypothetical protein ABH931_004917 [Streptacidiphilus sp. MAP12-33]|uniref:hypothetical protein n=1 Tax=Streptacidiphilus sp. MAP12-33 TaxID=3156266 RepID=UPI003512F949
MLRSLFTVATVGLLCAACASGPAAPSAASGTVSGVATAVGGPVGATPAPMSGDAVVKDASGGEVARVRLDAAGGYRLTLRSGSYTLTVAGAGAPCSPASFRITGGGTVKVDLTCQMK